MSQKDNEIKILVEHVEKNKGLVPVTGTEETKVYESELGTRYQEIGGDSHSVGMPPPSTTVETRSMVDRTSELIAANKNLTANVDLNQEELEDKVKAFEKFRRSY